MTLQEMTKEIREHNITKGWRNLDGTPSLDQTFGDYIALLHSEVSEMLEAFRSFRLRETTIKGKPEDVGSEAADVLIRLLDMCDIYAIDIEHEYVRKMNYNRTREWQHGGKTL